MSKVLTAPDYLVINNADCFLAAFAEGSNVPATMTVTLSALANTSTTAATLSVTALSNPLWEGQILRFGSVGSQIKVRLIADAAAGATSILVAVVPSAIANNSAAITYVLVPIYAVQAFNRSGNDQSESFSTFNTVSGSTEELILGRNKQFSCKGLTVENNPGYLLLEAADNGTGKKAQLYFEFIRDNNTGYKGFANVKNFRETNEVQKAIEIQWDFGISGKLYKIDDVI